MPAFVLCCPHAGCDLMVQTTHIQAGIACPRCRRLLRPIQNPSASVVARAASASGTPRVVLRCGGAACGVIVRASLAADEELSCPRCKGVLAAVAQPVSALRPTLDLKVVPDATLELPATSGATL